MNHFFTTIKEFSKKAPASRGFSLFETLVAIFILLLAVTGSMSLTQKSLSSSYYSRDQVIASFLAQDAVEYIRSIRDKNTITSLATGTLSPWMTGLSTCIGSTCKIDTTKDYSTGITSCVSGSCPLYFNSTNGAYTHDTSGTVLSRFSRSVTMTYVTGSSNQEISIVVTVKWKTGSFSIQTFQVRENLTNWGEI